MDSLQDKVAVISGAGSGIGAASARSFAEAGARIVGVDLDAGAAAGTVEPLGGLVVQGSVSEASTWDDAIAAATDLGGGVDIAHLNAGVYGWDGPIEDLPLETFQRTIEANICGVVLGTRAMVPAMRARGGGAIVVTASVAGIVAFEPNPLYTLTKHAVAGFVLAQAAALGADSISIDAVCPGIVDTPMTTEALGGDDARDLGLPLIAPETVAETVRDLAASEGTGRCVAVLAGHEPMEWAFPGFVDLFSAATPTDA